ncbi:MAG: 5-(carboxyamino)imidazole ribonucleotide synthase [Pseudomonadota bacterium]
MIIPDAYLGILGGGQLGRMFCVAAQTMGYRVMVLDPDPASPAARGADRHLCADYTDRAALTEMGRACAAVTCEFENVPAASLEFLAQCCTVRPAAGAVAIAQDRIAEKTFLRDQGFPTARCAVIRNSEDIAAALQSVPLPALLKRSRWGYDGKGQARVGSARELDAAWQSFGNAPCVLEELLPLQTEVSVVLARGAAGEMAVYPVVENQHAAGILDISIVPARVAKPLAGQAVNMARAVAERLDYRGVLAVEFFVLHDGRLLVNEMAPRPHNSGHYTLDACMTSQFEQQVRALCGLPLGEVKLLSPAVMVNLLGDLWARGAPRWDALLRHPRVKLHLYGKHEARPGRKMGHYTCLADNVTEALSVAREIKNILAGAA